MLKTTMTEKRSEVKILQKFAFKMDEENKKI